MSSLAESNKRFKAIRDQVIKDFQYDEYKLLDLLLNLSQLEFNVREIYRKMVDQKQTQWESLKNEAKERTQELSEVIYDLMCFIDLNISYTTTKTKKKRCLPAQNH